MTIEKMFNPESICIIGASETKGKWGFQILSNLISAGYKGDIYPINPKSTEIFGYKCYKNVLELKGMIDLAVIVVPAPYVANVLEECGQADIKNITIITAGFGEVGNVEEEKLIMSVAKKNGMNVIGPNTFGIICRSSKLNISLIKTGKL